MAHLTPTVVVLLFISCSAKALSKYTDMVDSVSRELLGQLADATDAARLALKQVRNLLHAGKLEYSIHLGLFVRVGLTNGTCVVRMLKSLA